MPAYILSTLLLGILLLVLHCFLLLLLLLCSTFLVFLQNFVIKISAMKPWTLNTGVSYTNALDFDLDLDLTQIKPVYWNELAQIWVLRWNLQANWAGLFQNGFEGLPHRRTWFKLVSLRTLMPSLLAALTQSATWALSSVLHYWCKAPRRLITLVCSFNICPLALLSFVLFTVQSTRFNFPFDWLETGFTFSFYFRPSIWLETHCLISFYFIFSSC